MGSKRAKKRTRYTLAPGPDIDLSRKVIRDSRGRRITQGYVDRAVADVHRKTGRGRPSLTGKAAQSPQVTFRLPSELRAKVKARARREGKRVSQVAREALEHYLVS